MLLIHFCLPIVLLIIMANAKRIVIKAIPYQSQDHPYYTPFTYIVRILLFIAFVFSVKSCGQTSLEEAFKDPPNQAFNSEIWKKNEQSGIVRHTMLKSLNENHSSLLGKNQTQVIKILGDPDTSSYYPNTDSTLYWHCVHPTIIMGSSESVIVYFKKRKSYKILFNYWPSQY
ncbi:hypothetical protein [Spirosoma oryzae]|uniref:hypothetical protein n=1 Tax=Spirosoma oryzae TaxID=1469603 RepID=UPI0011B20CDC|nr:hypothetical protein [Spirosoma oryzae]